MGKKVETWTNEQGIVIEKRCLSCLYCRADKLGTGLETGQRICESHIIRKGNNTTMTAKKIVMRTDVACDSWTPKKGLTKAGIADGHPVREINIVAAIDKANREYDKKHKKVVLR